MEGYIAANGGARIRTVTVWRIVTTGTAGDASDDTCSAHVGASPTSPWGCPTEPTYGKTF
jgi:hypothetical protein